MIRPLGVSLGANLVGFVLWQVLPSEWVCAGSAKILHTNIPAFLPGASSWAPLVWLLCCTCA